LFFGNSRCQKKLSAPLDDRRLTGVIVNPGMIEAAKGFGQLKA